MPANTAPKISGYSVWLHGTQEENCIFEAVMQRLRQGSESPAFIPHITLLGQIQNRPVSGLIEKLHFFAVTEKAFQIRFNKLDFKDDYYKACTLELHDRTWINSKRMQILKIFSTKPERKYYPHLSLYYGQAALTKTEICGEAEKLLSCPFKISRVSLVKTEGPVNNWEQECLCELK